MPVDTPLPRVMHLRSSCGFYGAEGVIDSLVHEYPGDSVMSFLADAREYGVTQRRVQFIRNAVGTNRFQLWEDLAGAALARLCFDACLCEKMGAAARRHVQKSFGAPAMGTAYEKLYSEAARK